MKLFFDKKLFNNDLKKYLSHTWIIYAFLGLIFISGIAVVALAHYHDDNIATFDEKELALIKFWFSIFCPILITSVVLFAAWPIGSILLSGLFAISWHKDSTHEDNNQTDAKKSPDTIVIDKSKLRELFSESFTDEKFDAFCDMLEKTKSEYKKREYGKLAEIIMYHSPHCSTKDKYKKTLNGEVEWKFSPYCSDFFSALGIESSTYAHNYFSSDQISCINDFRDIIDFKFRK